MRIALALAATPLLALAACQTIVPAHTRVATALLRAADGTTVGTVTATEAAGGVMINLTVSGLSAGPRGVHVHQVGACGPTFAAAGGHWNPASMTHGLDGNNGQHAGDMPNLEVRADGTGTLGYRLSDAATFDGLLDADGSAFIVHAGRDDQASDPTGNSGDRVACGVFAAG